MEIKKFTNFKKVFNRGDSISQGIHQREIYYANSIGYKLYYYKDFELVEIIELKKSRLKANDPWEDKWGEMIFFLNDIEFKAANKIISKSKELYDEHIKAAKTVSEIPMSAIYYDILKLKK